jgi:hypothetical protein
MEESAIAADRKSMIAAQFWALPRIAASYLIEQSYKIKALVASHVHK